MDSSSSSERTGIALEKATAWPSERRFAIQNHPENEALSTADFTGLSED